LVFGIADIWHLVFRSLRKELLLTELLSFGLSRFLSSTLAASFNSAFASNFLSLRLSCCFSPSRATCLNTALVFGCLARNIARGYFFRRHVGGLVEFEYVFDGPKSA